MKAEKPEEVDRNRILPALSCRDIFPPHSQPSFPQRIDIQYFTKITPALGYLGKHPKAGPIFYNLLIIKRSKNRAMDMGWKIQAAHKRTTNAAP